ncbi:MAG TPA: hypothetical protein VFI87_01630 [Hyphomicrobiaceae bacterium]|nr:hypothetical protein [Hyphomicrobiaceae bacterium]
MVVRSIGVWSAARLYGALTAAMGLIFGVIFALVSTLGAGLAAADDAPVWMSAVFGVGAVIILPVFYGVMGLVGGAVTAVLYNIFANIVGGVEIDVS